MEESVLALFRRRQHPLNFFIRQEAAPLVVDLGLFDAHHGGLLQPSPFGNGGIQRMGERRHVAHDSGGCADAIFHNGRRDSLACGVLGLSLDAGLADGLGREGATGLCDQVGVQFGQVVAAQLGLPPVQMDGLVADELFRLERQNFLAVSLDQVGNGMPFGNHAGEIPASLQLGLHHGGPVFGHGLVGEGLGLRRKAFDAYLNVIRLGTRCRNAFSNHSHVFLLCCA